MKIVCAPEPFAFTDAENVLNVVLYGQPATALQGSAGAAVKQQFTREKLTAHPRAWDFLSLGLSVVTADLAGHRNRSPDGWTREFDVRVAVSDPAFWNSQRDTIQKALSFLTTDRWSFDFVEGGFQPVPARVPLVPDEDCVVLLSGGLDSLIGAIDLAAAGKRPIAVSQLVRGDAEKQDLFAQSIGGGLRHLQLNHNANAPAPEEPPSQRARSFIFLAYGVLTATTLARHRSGQDVTLFLCENGFIAINPALTGTRLGSLSTRTAHPIFLGYMQKILDAAGFSVRIENPYQTKTKGEMLKGCSDQSLLRPLAVSSTSCGRFMRFGYKHCGRCVPCQVRRAAFLNWGGQDDTQYVYSNLGRDDSEHAGFDDVRSVAMALAEVKADGLDSWLGNALNSVTMTNTSALKNLVERGLSELDVLHRAYSVK